MDQATAPIIREVVWDIYCPRCLTKQDPLTQEGTAQLTRRIKCKGCSRPFNVTTRIDGQGRARCVAIPPFIRSPELVDDNNPPPLLR